MFLLNFYLFLPTTVNLCLLEIVLILKDVKRTWSFMESHAIKSFDIIVVITLVIIPNTT